ncbi:MAG: SpoIID/LytB domain-containing protein [Planctomycetia bacterium]
MRPGTRIGRRALLAGAAALPLAAWLPRPAWALPATSTPMVRVRLGAPRPRAVLRLSPGSWEVRSEAGQAYTLVQPGALEAVLAPGEAGLRLGERDTGATRLRIACREPFALDGTSYAGDLLVSIEGTQLLLVNELDLETYVAGVIPNECACHAPPATHRAQAVASRTYAYVLLAAPGAERAPFHLKDTQASQVYRGLAVAPAFGATAADMRQRTAETRGVLVTWQNRPLTTYFASTCGGHTTDPATSNLKADAEAAPLGGVRCGFCSTSSRFRWTKRIADEDLVAGMAARNLPIALPLAGIEVTQRGRGGWARQLVITAGPQRTARTVSGPDFRAAAGLNSHNILAIRRVAGAFEIDGGGWGHGVGMCQWGALEMGRRGLGEADILRLYYPGATLARLY